MADFGRAGVEVFDVVFNWTLLFGLYVRYCYGGELGSGDFCFDFEIGHCSSVCWCGIVIMGKVKGQFGGFWEGRGEVFDVVF